jgi:hypothetical protein
MQGNSAKINYTIMEKLHLEKEENRKKELSCDK